MTSTETRIGDNIALLEQAAALLEQLEPELYAAPGPPGIKSGVGGHVRHILDFYESFLAGLPGSRIDYEKRQRDPRVESDGGYAVERLQGTSQRLRQLGVPCSLTQLLVRAEGGRPAEAPSSWGRSSVGRELEFLMSHTVHHFALIAVILRLRGFDPGEEFGVAPSTLAHWRAAS